MICEIFFIYIPVLISILVAWRSYIKIPKNSILGKNERNLIGIIPQIINKNVNQKGKI